MSRIAIATLQGRNYGGRLQNYALLSVLSQNNNDVKSLFFGKVNNPLYPNILSRIRQYSVKEIVVKMRNIYNERKHRGEVASLLKTRFSIFDSFIDKYLCRTSKQTDEDRKNWEQQFDVLVCGSDQIWNPNAIDDPSFLGADCNIKRKISYAASIGRQNLSKYEASYMIPFINKLDAISVREKSAKMILESWGVAKPVKVVLDPTLLIDCTEWETLSAERIIPEPYVFVYSFSDCKLKHQIVDKYNKQGKRVFFIPFAQRVWNNYDGNSPMSPLYDIGPKEFLSLIRYADVVFTDSFHAAVFSIIFQKQFYVFERSKNGKNSMNSRIYDLLSTFSLEQCLLNPGDALPEKDVYIDYSYVDDRLIPLRNDSTNWLLNAIKND